MIYDLTRHFSLLLIKMSWQNYSTSCSSEEVEYPSVGYQKVVELFHTVTSIRKRMNCFAKIGSSEGGWLVLLRHLDQQEAEMSCQVIWHQKKAESFFFLSDIHLKRLNFFPGDGYQKEVEIFYTVMFIRKRIYCFAKRGSSGGGWIVLPRHLDQQGAEMSCQVIYMSLMFFFFSSDVHQKRLNIFPNNVYQKEVELSYTVKPIRQRMNALLSEVHLKEAE